MCQDRGSTQVPSVPQPRKPWDQRLTCARRLQPKNRSSSVKACTCMLRKVCSTTYPITECVGPQLAPLTEPWSHLRVYCSAIIVDQAESYSSWIAPSGATVQYRLCTFKVSLLCKVSLLSGIYKITLELYRSPGSYSAPGKPRQKSKTCICSTWIALHHT